jgi:hypothetical protein
MPAYRPKKKTDKGTGNRSQNIAVIDCGKRRQQLFEINFSEQQRHEKYAYGDAEPEFDVDFRAHWLPFCKGDL